MSDPGRMVGDTSRGAGSSSALLQWRCDTCGRRLPGDATANCPGHGPSTSPPRASSGVAIIDHPEIPDYRISRVLGRGGFGTVFAAEPRSGGAIVAIKVARRDRSGADQCLFDEARALRAVGPPHVPAVRRSGALPDGAAYVVMEYVAAETLAQRLVRGPDPIPLLEVAETADAVLAAVSAVHACGIVHGDLKPENVFIDGARRWAKLIDFGLARSPDGSLSTTVAEGAANAGTAEYMAPEQCEGGRRDDDRTDIYALGIMLYELLAGRTPFWGPRALVHQHHRDRRPPRLQVRRPISAALEDVVLRCLAKDPSDRFESADALRVALASAFAQAAPSQRRQAGPSPEPPTGARERRRMGIVFFESSADALAIQRRVSSLGGQLAHASGQRYVAIDAHEVGENPARRALRIAQALLDRDLCARALIDVGPVLVQTRADGSRRLLSSLFSRADRFLVASDPRGLVVTSSAAGVLPDLTATALADDRGFFQVEVPRSTFPAPSRSSELGSAALIGRDDVIEALLAGARRAVEANVPTIASVVAEAGYGKTHLSSVLVERLRSLDLGAAMIELRGREHAGGGAEPTLRDLLYQALQLPASAPPDGGRAILTERLGERGAELWPTVALALDWIAPDAVELRARTAAPRALRSALTLAVSEALRRATRRPLFVLLDDAHLAGDVTLAALEHAALAEAGAPIWICALGRPSFETSHPAWGERAARHEVHHLGALDPESAAALCRRLLRPVVDVPEAAVRRIVDQAQAIPVVLVEIVRNLERDGHVRRHPKGDGWFLAADGLERPPDLPILEWLAEAELDALPATLRAHARLLALLGPDVSVIEVEGVVRELELAGLAPEITLDARTGIRRLVAAGVLTSQRGERARFRHALTREAVARSTPPALQRTVHLAASAYYRRATTLGEEHRATRLAHHAAAASLRPEAAAAYLELAERARARHAYVDAELLFNRAIVESDAPSLEAYRGRGLMRYRLERYQDALADFALARAAATSAHDAATEMEILLDEATALDWMDEYTSSEERVTRARAIADSSRASPFLEARLSLGIGRSLHRFSREAEAAERLERAVTLAAALGDVAYETQVIALMLLGFIYPVLGQLDDAGRAIESSVRLCEEHGDTLHLVAAINNRALYRAYLGDVTGMRADFGRVLMLARELGHRTPELFAHYNLAEYLTLMDHVEDAEPYVQRAIAIEERRAGDAGRPVVALLAARVELYRGDEDKARSLLARIRSHQGEARAAGRIDRLLVPSEDVLASAVDLATRDASDEEWDELEARSARYSVGQEKIEVLEARALAAFRRHRRDEARSGLEKALAAAAGIPNVMGVRLRRELAEVEAS